YKPQDTFYANGGSFISRLQALLSSLRQSLLQLADADGVDTVIEQELEALQDQLGTSQAFVAVSRLGKSIQHLAKQPVSTDRDFWVRAFPSYLTIQENNVVRLLVMRAYFRLFG